MTREQHTIDTAKLDITASPGNPGFFDYALRSENKKGQEWGDRTFIRGFVIKAERFDLALDTNNGPRITGIGLAPVRASTFSIKVYIRTT